MKPIEKVSITDRTVQSIRNHIITANCQPGEKLPTESELVNDLEVSRSTVREALRVLQAQGTIEIIHGRGAFVKKQDIAENSPEKWFAENTYEIADIMNVRLALEQMAIKLAIRNITDEEIDGLQEIEDQFEQALADGNITHMALYDEYFHEHICKCSHNSLIVSITKSLSEALQPYRNNSFAIVENRAHATGPHRDILYSLRQRSTRDAIEAVVNHINISLRDMERVADRMKQGANSNNNLDIFSID